MMKLTSSIDAQRIEFDYTVRPDELRQTLCRKFGSALAVMARHRLYPYTIVTSMDCHAKVCHALGAKDIVSASMIGHVSHAGIRINSPFAHTISIKPDERLKDDVLYILFEKCEPFIVDVSWRVDDMLLEAD